MSDPTPPLPSSPLLLALAALPVHKPKTPEEAHANAMALGARCKECVFWSCNRGPVPSTIRLNPLLAIVGEGPGKHEVQQGENFVGASGVELDEGLALGGMTRADVAILNATRCRPPEKQTLEDVVSGLNRAYGRIVKRAKAQEAALAKSEGRKPRKITATAPKPGKEGSVVYVPKPLTPMEACRPALKTELDQVNARNTLAVGGKALQAMCQRYGIPYGAGKDTVGRIASATIKHQHGSPIILPAEHVAAHGLKPDGQHLLLSSLHPAFAMNDKREYTQRIRDEIGRACSIAIAGGPSWRKPNAVIMADAATYVRELRRMAMARLFVTVDIETNRVAHPSYATIYVVGVIGQHPGEPETSLVVPFRWRDKRDYWTNPAEKQAVAQALYDVLNNCPLGMHNGMFDTLVLKHKGLLEPWSANEWWDWPAGVTNADGSPRPAARPWMDTMLGYHSTDWSEMPKDLGTVTRQFFDAPLWKKDVSAKDSAGVGTDRDMHVYNGEGDLPAQHRLAPIIMDRVAMSGQTGPYAMNMALAPVYREMGALGVIIDEVERGRLSEAYNGLSIKLRARFNRQVGREINPRSWQQVGDWLYGSRADGGNELMPPLNPQKRPWKEGDDWTTSTPALMMLADDQGVPKAMKPAINTLLELRACETARGRSVDRLPSKHDDELAALCGKAPRVRVIKAAIDRSGDEDEEEEGAEPETEEEAMKREDAAAEDAAAAASLKDDEVASLFGEDAVFSVLPERAALTRLLVSWKLHVTPSNRAVCDPTLQNWTTRGWAVKLRGDKRARPINMRAMIVAAPGHMIVGADASAVEARIYAAESQDRILLKAFNEGLDVHLLNFAYMETDGTDINIVMAQYQYLYDRYKKKEKLQKSGAWTQLSDDERAAIEDDVGEVKYLREIAKRMLYGETYGCESDKLHEVMSTERDKATNKLRFPNLEKKRVLRWDERWHVSHPETKRWQHYEEQSARRLGYTEERVTGRRRWFIHGANKPDAPANMRIQGAAGGYKMLAVLQVAEAIPFRRWSRWSGLILDIHDYVAVQVPESRAEEAAKIIERAMTYQYGPVKLFGEPKISRSLGQNTA